MNRDGILRIGPAGMRGTVPGGLSPRTAMAYVSALGAYLDGGRVVLAGDTRISTGLFRHAALAALLAAGCRVVDAGTISAPELHWLIPHLGADGGLLIGGCHHPMGWNVLSPLAADGAFFHSVRSQELLDLYHSHRHRRQPWNRIGVVESPPADASERYLDRLCALVDVDAVRAAGLTVVADFCNGSGAPMGHRFADRLGLRLIALNDTFSGFLPHDPEPRPRSSRQAQSILTTLGADIGFVFNSDMSRAAVITSAGETLSEEYTVVLAADEALSRLDRPGRLVTNVCTTRSLDRVAARHGAEVRKTRVGEPFLIRTMMEWRADLAGDGSGSAAFGRHVAGYDMYAVMGVLLQAMATRKCSSADLADAIPRYAIIKRSIACRSSHAYAVLRSFSDAFPDAAVTEEDGFRFDWDRGWMHVRASMTEPIVRMIIEWESEDGAEDLALQARGLLERAAAS
jgi:phosphomannomutase